MNIDEQKREALQCCIDIANDYSEEEVKKFCSLPVQMAWKVGNEYLEYKIKENRAKTKGFTI